eukprot:6424449-Amphidinium_carterae.1
MATRLMWNSMLNYGKARVADCWGMSELKLLPRQAAVASCFRSHLLPQHVEVTASCPTPLQHLSFRRKELRMRVRGEQWPRVRLPAPEPVPVDVLTFVVGRISVLLNMRPKPFVWIVTDTLVCTQAGRT